MQGEVFLDNELHQVPCSCPNVHIAVSLIRFQCYDGKHGCTSRGAIMKICILDGSHTDEGMGERFQKILGPLLKEHQVQHFIIRDLKIASCMGDFLCWTKTPGICKNKDDNRLIAEAVVQSNLLIFLTPVTFGGYSSLLKQGIDHLIQIISPFFVKVQGETHHKKRYRSYPNLAVFGWNERQDTNSELIFKHLVERNSINLYAQKTFCEVFHPEDQDEQITQRITSILGGTAPQLQHHALPLQEASEVRPSEEKNQTGIESALEKQPEIGIEEKEKIQTERGTRIQKTILLVGSPRKEQSSSLSLGSYLCSHLVQHSIE
ncbi:MAG: flavodoxin family protein, partial [Spirochaetia bacterium]|nr:flavodoxin family protein [Spirochaetia bacterium]